MPVAAVTALELQQHVDASLARSHGGWIVTANLDVLMHFVRDDAARDAYMRADLRVADGMPLLWAARLLGRPLPERVAGSTFAWSLAELCARRGAHLFLLGGAPGTAEQAGVVCRERHPSLRVDADSTVRFGTNLTDADVEPIARRLEQLDSRVVLVGLGSPKQELLIAQLRRRLPRSWFVGVGGTFAFMSGAVRRAPPFLQRTGFEWAHRFALDPGRLGPRYAKNLGFLVGWAYSGLRRRISA
jgi:N-acetylglucosaminyldiphosphoundecaprenol N-acetyl-beta-D-mannosaminyltransferase